VVLGLCLGRAGWSLHFQLLFLLSHSFLRFCFHCYPLVGWFGSVTGALGRKTDPKITTALKTQRRSKHQIKIKIIPSRIKR